MDWGIGDSARVDFDSQLAATRKVHEREQRPDPAAVKSRVVGLASVAATTQACAEVLCLVFAVRFYSVLAPLLR